MTRMWSSKISSFLAPFFVFVDFRVIHNKRQQAVDVDANSDPLFEFNWHLVLQVDCGAKDLSSDIEIRLSELELSSTIDSQKGETIRNAIEEKKSIK